MADCSEHIMSELEWVTSEYQSDEAGVCVATASSGNPTERTRGNILYGQSVLSKNVSSAIERLLGHPMRVRMWYHEFRRSL